MVRCEERWDEGAQGVQLLIVRGSIENPHDIRFSELRGIIDKASAKSIRINRSSQPNSMLFCLLS